MLHFSFTIALSWILLLSCVGCNDSVSPTSESHVSTSSENLTMRDGEIIEGNPKLIEDVEQEIYQSLNHRRKMMASISKRSGSSRGIQQMQDELNLLTKGFMNRYNIAQVEIDQILAKGDSNHW